MKFSFKNVIIVKRLFFLQEFDVIELKLIVFCAISSVYIHYYPFITFLYQLSINSNMKFSFKNAIIVKRLFFYKILT